MGRAQFVWAAMLWVTACGGGDGGGAVFLDDLDPATFDTPEKAQEWATSASAPNVLAFAVLPISLADIQRQSGDTCPTKTESGTTVTYTGGCTDQGGQTWVGKAVVSMGASGSYRYEGFGFSGMEDCNGTMHSESLKFDGSLTIEMSGNGSTFEIEMTGNATGAEEPDCVDESGRWAIVYSGSMRRGGPDTDADGQPDDQVFNGSGKIGSELTGVAEAVTEDEIVNEAVCPHEAASGKTTVTAGGHSLVITYDGATDCDPESTVTWSYDGMDRGELMGVQCAVASGRRAAPPVGIPLWVLFTILMVRARRRA